jgi:2-oxoglutarate ferredoxin oxidoreductase subunit alpha
MSAAPPSLQGNRACALGAIAAGCRFFAGYPITPSSEIAETMSRELPRVGGVFIQMEDEIGSLAAAIGASLGGVKAMTATSGPGFSLMQEHLGYAALTEVPCVIIDVMRGGPSTGMPTRPAQGDLMQARWGTHGDHPIVALAPASVQEIYSETIRAFNLAERLRTPVVVLFDEVVAHLLESVTLPAPGSIVVAERKWAKGDERDFHPFAETDDLIPPTASLPNSRR